MELKSSRVRYCIMLRAAAAASNATPVNVAHAELKLRTTLFAPCPCRMQFTYGDAAVCSGCAPVCHNTVFGTVVKKAIVDIFGTVVWNSVGVANSLRSFCCTVCSGTLGCCCCCCVHVRLRARWFQIRSEALAILCRLVRSVGLVDHSIIGGGCVCSRSFLCSLGGAVVRAPETKNDQNQGDENHD